MNAGTQRRQIDCCLWGDNDRDQDVSGGKMLIDVVLKNSNVGISGIPGQAETENGRDGAGKANTKGQYRSFQSHNDGTELR